MAQIQALGDDAAFVLWWLVGRQDLVQLEFFHHTTPPQRRSRPTGRRTTSAGRGSGSPCPTSTPCSERLAASASRRSPTASPTTACDGPASATRTRVPRRGAGGGCGDARRHPAAVLRPRAGRRLRARSPCPTSARRGASSCETLGLVEEPGTVLHPPELEALWGLAGAQRESFVARGGDVYLEVVRYDDPAGRPLPDDHLLSDRGFMNVALGFREQRRARADLRARRRKRLPRQLPRADGRRRHVRQRRPGQHRSRSCSPPASSTPPSASSRTRSSAAAPAWPQPSVGPARP